MVLCSIYYIISLIVKYIIIIFFKGNMLWLMFLIYFIYRYGLCLCLGVFVDIDVFVVIIVGNFLCI